MLSTEDTTTGVHVSLEEFCGDSLTDYRRDGNAQTKQFLPLEQAEEIRD